jgi:Integrase zinc binding domain/Integrase core domain
MERHLYYGLIKYLSTKEIPLTLDPDTQKLVVKLSPHYSYSNTTLIKLNDRHDTHGGRQNRIVIPQHQKLDILKQAHDEPLAGHLGQDNTYHRLSQTYYWPNLRQDVINYIRSCKTCQKRERRKGKAPLQPIIKTPIPFYHVGIDVMGPLPRTPTGHRYIIVAIDHFTKWVEATATETADAQTITKFLYEDIICRHGIPTLLTSDRGTEFINELVTSLTSVYKIRHIRTTAYNPQANGQVERANRTIKDILAKITPRITGDWSHYLQTAVHVTRVTKQGSTHFTPSELLYGYQMRQHFDMGQFDQDQKDPEDYFLEEVTRINEVRQQAAKFIKKAQERQKDYHDTHNTLTEPLKIGDLVLIYRSVVESSWSAKLEPKWEGPYMVQNIKETTYSLRNPHNGSILPNTFHRNRLKKYHGRPPSLSRTPSQHPTVEIQVRRRR